MLSSSVGCGAGGALGDAPVRSPSSQCACCAFRVTTACSYAFVSPWNNMYALARSDSSRAAYLAALAPSFDGFALMASMCFCRRRDAWS